MYFPSAPLRTGIFILLAARSSWQQSQTVNDFDVFSAPLPGVVIAAGSAYDIRWYKSPAPYDGNIWISYINNGQPDSNPTFIVNNTDSSRGKYTWNVPDTLDWSLADYEDPVFTLRIWLGPGSTAYSYSGSFNISGIANPSTNPNLPASTSSGSSTSTPTSSSRSTSSTSTSTSTLDSPDASASSSPTTTTTSSKSGLSTGAKAGIAVGAVAVVAIVVALLFFLRRRRLQRHRGAAELPATTDSSPTTQYGSTAATNYEVPEKGRHEGPTMVQEMDATQDYRGLAEADSTPIVSPFSPEQTRLRRDTVVSKSTVSESQDIHSSDQISAVSAPPYGSADTKIDNMNSVLEQMRRDNKGTGGEDGLSDERFEALKKKLERVRMDKERLLKVQELEEMENELKNLVMDENRRRFGVGG